nr:hypothetical protein [Formivibrio citricus]
MLRHEVLGLRHHQIAGFWCQQDFLHLIQDLRIQNQHIDPETVLAGTIAPIAMGAAPVVQVFTRIVFRIFGRFSTQHHNVPATERATHHPRQQVFTRFTCVDGRGLGQQAWQGPIGRGRARYGEGTRRGRGFNLPVVILPVRLNA